MGKEFARAPRAPRAALGPRSWQIASRARGLAADAAGSTSPTGQGRVSLNPPPLLRSTICSPLGRPSSSSSAAPASGRGRPSMERAGPESAARPRDFPLGPPKVAPRTSPPKRADSDPRAAAAAPVRRDPATAEPRTIPPAARQPRLGAGDRVPRRRGRSDAAARQGGRPVLDSEAGLLSTRVLSVARVGASYRRRPGGSRAGGRARSAPSPMPVWRPDRTTTATRDATTGSASSNDATPSSVTAARAELDEARLRGRLVQLALVGVACAPWRAREPRAGARAGGRGGQGGALGRVGGGGAGRGGSIHQGDPPAADRAPPTVPPAAAPSSRSSRSTTMCRRRAGWRARRAAAEALAPRDGRRLDGRFERINSLSDMLSMGLLTAGDAVLSVTCCGVLFLADRRCRVGSARHTPPAGGPAQLFETPAGFVRAVRFSSGITVRPLPRAPRPAPPTTRSPSPRTPPSSSAGELGAGVARAALHGRELRRAARRRRSARGGGARRGDGAEQQPLLGRHAAKRARQQRQYARGQLRRAAARDGRRRRRRGRERTEGADEDERENWRARRRHVEPAAAHAARQRLAQAADEQAGVSRAAAEAAGPPAARALRDRHGVDDEDATRTMCDGCDKGYHTHCMQPPLLVVPDGAHSARRASSPPARRCTRWSACCGSGCRSAPAARRSGRLIRREGARAGVGLVGSRARTSRRSPSSKSSRRRTAPRRRRRGRRRRRRRRRGRPPPRRRPFPSAPRSRPSTPSPPPPPPPPKPPKAPKLPKAPKPPKPAAPPPVRQLQPSLLGAEEPALSSCTCKAACSAPAVPRDGADGSGRRRALRLLQGAALLRRRARRRPPPRRVGRRPDHARPPVRPRPQCARRSARRRRRPSPTRSSCCTTRATRSIPSQAAAGPAFEFARRQARARRRRRRRATTGRAPEQPPAGLATLEDLSELGTPTIFAAAGRVRGPAVGPRSPSSLPDPRTRI